jgi:hypothetical protein
VGVATVARRSTGFLVGHETAPKLEFYIARFRDERINSIAPDSSLLLKRD